MFTDRFIQVDWDPLWCWNLRIWSGPLVELHSALLPLTEGKCQFMPRCRYAHHIKSSSHLPCLVRSVCMRTHLDHAGFDTGLIVLRRALMHPVDNRPGYCRYKTYGQASRVITGIRWDNGAQVLDVEPVKLFIWAPTFSVGPGGIPIGWALVVRQKKRKEKVGRTRRSPEVFEEKKKQKRKRKEKRKARRGAGNFWTRKPLKNGGGGRN